MRRYSATDRDIPKVPRIGTEKDNSTENFFKIVYTNATSLNNKIMELELYLRCSEWPHVVCVAETWFSELSVPSIGGYTLYGRDRNSVHGHGGVCLYVRGDVRSIEVLNVGEDERGV